MKNLFKFLFVLSFIFVLAAMPVITAHAAPQLFAPQMQSETPLPSLPDLLDTLKNLGGLAALFAAIVNGLKYFNILQDGYAPSLTLIFNTASLIGLVALQVTGKADFVPVIDQSAGLLATVLTATLALIYQLWVGRKTHTEVLTGMPVIGKSYSNRKAGENVVLEVTNLV